MLVWLLGSAKAPILRILDQLQVLAGDLDPAARNEQGFQLGEHGGVEPSGCFGVGNFQTPLLAGFAARVSALTRLKSRLRGRVWVSAHASCFLLSAAFCFQELAPGSGIMAFGELRVLRVLYTRIAP